MDHYSLEDHTFAVRATDVGFVELLRGYIGHLRARGESADPDVLYSADCGVDKILAGGKKVRGINHLWAGSLKIFQGRLQEEMAGRLISSMRDYATAHSNEFVKVRAVGVELKGGAVILPSLPSPHLAALAGLLVQRGARYLGDELLKLDPILMEAHGLPLPVLIDGFDLPLFPKIRREPSRRRPKGSPEEIGGRTPRRPVPVEELGGTLAGPTPIRWISFPTFQTGAETSWSDLGRAEAVFRFTQAMLNMHIWGDRTFGFINGLIEAVPVSHLVVGDLRKAADALLQRADAMVSA